MKSFAIALRLCSCVLGLSLAGGVALAQTAADLAFPIQPDRTISLDGDREVHVYKGTVERVVGGRLTIRYPHGERHTYTVPSDFRFDINGRKVPARSLRRGDELTAYVTVHDTADHEIHHVEESAGTAEVISSVTPEAVADMLPMTASPLPLLGLLGAISMGLGAFGLFLRRRLA